MSLHSSFKNETNIKDFKRSLLNSIFFPAITLIVMFFSVAWPVVDEVARKPQITELFNRITLMRFIPNESEFLMPLIQIGFVLCGMLTAAKSLGFLMSKSKSNVYLSLGVKRSTMLVNRFVASAIPMFVAAFVPLFIVYAVNLMVFGSFLYSTQIFLYALSLAFVSGLAGFSITALMMSLSGNIVEALIATYAFSKIGITTANLIDKLSVEYMQGIMPHWKSSLWLSPREDITWVNILSPWSMAFDFNKNHYDRWHSNAEYRIGEMLMEGKPFSAFKVTEDVQIDFGLVLPVIIWFVFSIVFVAVATFLLNRRKVENAGTLGKFNFPRVTIGVYVFCVSAVGVANLLAEDISLKSAILISLAVAFVAFVIVQAVMLRSFKPVLKSLLEFALLTGVFMVIASAVNTGVFGLYNRMPDKSDVKSVSVDIQTGSNSFFNHWVDYIPNGYNGELIYNPYIESETDESKETVFDVCKLLSVEKIIPGEDYLAEITVSIRDNDGDVKYRIYQIYNEETFLKYLRIVFDSDFFDMTLKNDLIVNHFEDETPYYRACDWHVSDSDLLETADKELFKVADSAELCDALYKDLSVMTFDQIYRNNKMPVCILLPDTHLSHLPWLADDTLMPNTENLWGDNFMYGIGSEEIETYGYYTVEGFIPVYREMTNTIKYLEKIGYDINSETLEIKEILYTDSKLSCYDATIKWAEVNEDGGQTGIYSETVFSPFAEARAPYSVFSDYRAIPFSKWMIEAFVTKETTAYDLLKEIYDDNGHPLTSVTDKEKTAEIIENTAVEYFTPADDGRYIYVIYTDGKMLCYYVPEANVSVLN